MKIAVVNVNDVYEGLTKYFKDRVRLSLVHGKMGDSEKKRQCWPLQRGELGVLVATTVIEVGIDVKEASMMIIYDAQSFGLRLTPIAWKDRAELAKRPVVICFAAVQMNKRLSV